MVLAFCLETFVIFIATQVLTQLATAQHVDAIEPNLNGFNVSQEKVGGWFRMKEMHDSMVDFLLKNFEFEYATCRLHFVTGLLSFTLATALRVRYALRKYR